MWARRRGKDEDVSEQGDARAGAGGEGSISSARTRGCGSALTGLVPARYHTDNSIMPPAAQGL